MEYTCIFHTYIECENKICRLIINSGSSINMISKFAVVGTKLQSKPYPWPYKVALGRQ